MGTELDLTRAAWQDALLRGDERLGQGDDKGALDALEDQRRLLHLLEGRLQRVVAAAAAERDAEQILAGAESLAPCPPTGTTDPDPAVAPGTDEPRGRLRALVAAGAATAVTAVAVGLAAMLGSVAPPAPEVAEAPEGAEDVTAFGADETVDDGGSEVAAADRGGAEAAPPVVEPTPWLPGWAAPWAPSAEVERDGAAPPSPVSEPSDEDRGDPAEREAERDEGDDAQRESTPDGDLAGDGSDTGRDEDDDAETGPEDDAEEHLIDLEDLIRGDEPGPEEAEPEEADGDLSGTEAESSTSSPLRRSDS